MVTGDVNSRASGLEDAAPPLRRGRLWALAILAGVASGLIAWAAGEPLREHFRPAERWVDTMGYKSLRPTPRDSLVANIKNTLLAYGLLAVAVASSLGVVGGVARGAFRSGLIAGGIGALTGLALTCAFAIPAQMGYWRYFGDNTLTEELLVPYAAHAASWSAIGVAGGLALAVGAGGSRSSVIRGVVGGLLGAIAGTALYEFVGAAFFPLDGTTFPISISSGSRLLARMSVSVGVALLATKLLSVGLSRSERDSKAFVATASP